MLLRRIVSLAIASCVVCAGCTRKTSDRDLVFVTPFQAVEKVNTTPGLFDKKLNTVWVDPRTPELFAAGHIPGAISLPFPRMSNEAELILKGYDQFIVYDSDWEDTIGKAASKRLMEIGFDNVFTLEGGLKAWKRDGNDVETSVAVPADAPSSAQTAAQPPPNKPSAN